MSVVYSKNDEEIIYNLIRKYTHKKPISKIMELAHFLNYQLKGNQNFTKAKILRIIKDLIKKRLIIIGSKLVKDNILANRLRRQIYEYILNNPGSTIYNLRKAFHIGANQVIWHLNFLIKFEFVKTIRIEKHKVIFSFESESKYYKIFYYIANEKVKSILNAFKENKHPLSPLDLSKLLCMHYITVKKYLEILIDTKIVELTNEKRKYVINYDVYNEIIFRRNKIK
ncbi:MAG: hypothetical protein KGD63_10310 [Candidatus Lokiarchaeota archaeon]|nr:hypothetical protein [Candidatus Lokiarchaeota archaeon]